MSKDKEPDKVTHDVESPIPFAPPGIGPDIHTTKIHKDGKTYTGYGADEEEANEQAGRKYQKGDADD